MNVHPHGRDSLRQESQMNRFAEMIVRAGLGLVPGQELIIAAPIGALPLVRRVTEHAYRAGCTLVTTLFTDEEVVLTRFRHAPDESFDRAPGWLFDGMLSAFRNGAARLAIVGENPALLAGHDPLKVARANRANAQAHSAVLGLVADLAINWTIVPYAMPAWAKAVFPDAPAEVAVRKLWNAIFAASRADQPDPIAAWTAHAAELKARARFLSEKQFSTLHFRGPGTDLHVGLAVDHEWNGGVATAKNGAVFSANIPSEEVFTAPHKDRVDGVVRSTKALAHKGTLIEDLTVSFADGRVVEAKARSGGAVLQQIFGIDEGARRLGEVALVPNSSPISRSGLTFYNTLFDENAASHIAFGKAFNKCFRNASATEDSLAARGLNRSLVHIDWMIGSAEIDVDGFTSGGNPEPLMRRGEWACDPAR